MRYLYCTRDQSLIISPDRDVELSLCAYADANWMDPRETEGLDDKWKPQYGYLVFLGNLLVSWISKRLSCRTLSTMESEYYAASECCKELLLICALLAELGMAQQSATVMYEDNAACISYSKNNTCHARTKHIDNRAYKLRDSVIAGDITLVHVGTDHQLADMLTKTMLLNTFTNHIERINEGDIKPPNTTKNTKHVVVPNCLCISCWCKDKEKEN